MTRLSWLDQRAAADDLRVLMRRLWEEHVGWTRQVIISFAAGLPDLDAAKARLLRNQADIGAAFASVYGPAVGGRLERLLREHILGAVDVLEAAKRGSGLDAAVTAWRVNANEIADYLAVVLNTRGRVDLRTAMQEHLTTTIAEAQARLAGRWEDDVRAYDAVREHALQIADVLASEITVNRSE